MTKLPRITQKIFGDTAIQDNAIAQFGSVVAQNPLFTGDIEQIQALDYWSKGWVGATVTARRYPTAEETTGINKVVTQQLAYIFQEGIPEYDAGTTYPKGGWCKGLNADVSTIYESLEDDNINNPLTDTTKWKVVEFSGGGGGLEVCDIGMALYVDETKGLRRYLNGQVVDINTNTQAFLNRLLQIKTTNPDWFTTEENWQAEATLNIDGCVYKFVLNYSGADVVSVRLPKYPDYVEINAGGTLPVSIYGDGNALMFGNTDGSEAYYLSTNNSYNNSKPLYLSNNKTGTTKVGGKVSITQNTAHIGSNVAYGIATKENVSNAGSTSAGLVGETTLKQTKLKMRYFIQIATGSETENNIVNDIELNNPFSLFDSKYSDHELNNLSWLKSEGQWNAKSVYPNAYDKLLKVYNGTETVEGLSVKLNTEDYTDYDFRINTADETFRLPLKNGDEHIPDYSNGTVITSTNAFIVPSNGVVAGTIDAGIRANKSVIINGQKVESAWGGDTAQDGCPFYAEVKKGDSVVVEKILTSNDFAKPTFYPFVGNGSLYYYVGETVQNANLIDAGRIGEQLANKQDKCIHIIDTYVNGTSGYNIWSNGYCEQWGQALLPPSDTTVNLLKTYKNTDYNLVGMFGGTTVRESMGVAEINTENSFKIYHEAGLNAGFCLGWKTSGYLAQGEY